MIANDLGCQHVSVCVCGVTRWLVPAELTKLSLMTGDKRFKGLTVCEMDKIVCNKRSYNESIWEILES